jgi:peptidoglycan hydrolase-like protein with peptidoglycan-binding domain
MKVRHLVVAASAALLSFGAVAGGEQHSQNKDAAAPQASESAVIREAQDALRSNGYAATPQGLREFQQAQGLEPSGTLDQQTLAALGVGASAASGASSEPTQQPRERQTY